MDTLAYCAFGPGQYLIFGPSVGPLQYYSHLPIVAIALALAFFIIINNRKGLANQILFWTTIAYASWVFFDSIIWATNESSLIMFMWSLQVLIEPAVYIGCLYLLCVLTTGKDVSFLTKLVWFALYLPVIVLVPTVYTLSGFSVADCLAVEGPLALYYVYIVEGLFILSILGVTAHAIWRSRTPEDRKKAIFLSIGIVLLLAAFSSGNIIGSFTGDWDLAQYGLFGMPIFTAFLTYTIVRYQAFDTKLIGSIVLVLGLCALNMSLLFVQEVSLLRIVAALTFVLSVIFGIILVRSISQDTSRREHMEKLAKDLSLANDRLKELDHMKSEFLSIASHQLRAPITAVRGYAANLNEGLYGKIPEYLREPLETVQEAARLMANSIEDYLNISRIEQGRMKYEKSPMDIADLAKKVVNELAPVAAKKKLALIADVPENIMVTADIGKIKQVIVNLVDNAIKYTQTGSVTVSASQEGNKIHVTVTDTGVGIAPEEIGILFEKFKRARGANKVNTTGTGLGLYVARQLAEGHGGSVRVESAGAGKGSKFILELPA